MNIAQNNCSAQMPVIAGVEITTDSEGRFNLNALHKASGGKSSKRPKAWLATKQAQELVLEQGQNSALGQNVVKIIHGGNDRGTFAHELLAISYAGWVSPSFQLKVNQVFLDFKSGKLTSFDPSSLSRIDILQMALTSEQERMKLEAANEQLTGYIQTVAPKVEFAERVELSMDAISVREAAKILGTGQNRLYIYLRQIGWVNRFNKPYQSRLDSGYLDVKISRFEHPYQGLRESVTTLVTGKGLTRLQKLLASDPMGDIRYGA